MPTNAPHTCFLFDNGSLRPASTRSLRRLAAAVAERLAVEVRPVSLLHSSGVNPDKLDGRAAELLEPALGEFARGGGRVAVLLPLFFGPSAALTDYVPKRVAAVQAQHSDLVVIQAQWLVEPESASEVVMAAMLADAVRTVLPPAQLTQARVVLTDHGSPVAAVTKVRNYLGCALAGALQGEVAAVQVASMERREGDAYRFNEPLLAAALRQPGFDRGDVIVALQFLQSGRHAGPDGDIAEICAAACAERPLLRTHMTEPLVGDPRLVDLLEVRYREALRSAASAQ